MQKKSNSITNKKYLNKQAILLCIIILYFLSISLTFGRYVVKKVQTYISTSKEFYFYSDKLSDREKEYPINWSGTEECIIPINLYTKLNNLKKAKHDVKYKVEYEMVSSNAICRVDKETGIVSHTTNNDVITLSVIPNSLIEKNDKVIVKVKVTTIDDFEKTLEAKFVINVNNDSVQYNIDDEAGRDYFTLIINNMKKENIHIEFDPDKVIIDNTNDIFSNLLDYELQGSYINKISFTMDAMSNVNIKFFKKDKSMDYTDNNDIIIFNHEPI